MTKYATIIIPYALTPRWAQIVIASLKEHKNTKECEIYIGDNSYSRWPSTIPEELKDKSHAQFYWGDNRGGLKCITETSLGEGINIINTNLYYGATKDHRMYPGNACDVGLDIADTITKTPYLFTLDSDTSVNRDDWLDWYASFMKDDYVAMAGFWWNHPNRFIINPCATLYNMRILKKLREETRNNQEPVICYGKDNEKRLDYTGKFISDTGLDMWTDRIIRGYGPFTEQRGFFHNIKIFTGPFGLKDWNRDYWAKDFDGKAGHEHGSWLYNRAVNQWECVAVPGAWNNLVGTVDEKTVKMDETGSYYGDSVKDAYVWHYWGGTGAHSFKMGINANASMQEALVQWCLVREYELWKKFVPEFIRKESLEKGYIEDFDNELHYVMGRMTIQNAFPVRVPLFDPPRRIP